jgi:hypothetical protein
MMRHRNIYSYFMQREGGRFYGIVKIGQQEYDVALILYGVNPSVANLMRTFCASLVKFASSHLEPSMPHNQMGAPSLGRSHVHLPYATSCV